MTYHVGIDIAKDKLDVHVLDDQARSVAKTFTIPNRPAAILKLLQRLPDPAACRLYFEATGGYGKQLIRLLDRRVAALFEINPKIIKNHATSMTATKTDSADARAIADAGHTLSLKKPHVLRRYEKHYSERDEDLGLYLAEYDRLRRHLAQLHQRLDQLTHHPAPAAQPIARHLAAEIERATQRQAEIERHIERLSDRDDVRLVESIKGVGRKTAAAVCRHIGDIQRFQSADQLKAHFGIYPARRQSGSRERPSRMAKHGNKLIRHLLWNCAKSAARWNPACHQLAQRLFDKGHNYPTVWGAVMRKLVQIIYGVLKTKTPWKPNQHLTSIG